MKPYDVRTLQHVVKVLVEYRDGMREMASLGKYARPVRAELMNKAGTAGVLASQFEDEIQAILKKSKATARCSCGGKKHGFTCAENCASSRIVVREPVAEQHHVLQVTDSKGNWRDYAPGCQSNTNLAQTIDVAKALKPDGRRMRVATFTQTAVHEVGLTTRKKLAATKNKRPVKKE